jgi:hypothetical protein
MVKMAPITSFLVATYNRKGTPLHGALRIGGVDKYSLISSNITYCSAPQTSSASFFNRRIGVKAFTLPDKFDMNRLK